MHCGVSVLVVDSGIRRSRRVDRIVLCRCIVTKPSVLFSAGGCCHHEQGRRRCLSLLAAVYCTTRDLPKQSISCYQTLRRGDRVQAGMITSRGYLLGFNSTWQSLCIPMLTTNASLHTSRDGFESCPSKRFVPDNRV